MLQEVKGHLVQTYPQTTMRGDGQVVIVGFNTVTIEVVPAFRYDDQARFYIPDTNNGGRWKPAAPFHEINSLHSADVAANGNVRPMAQMLKVWKDECKVPLKSFLLEIISGEFMRNYVYRQYDYFWYDWFMRDFFFFLCAHARGIVTAPGTGEKFELGDNWLSRAESARGRALQACAFEQADMTVAAGVEWQQIFGNRIPIHVL